MVDSENLSLFEFVEQFLEEELEGLNSTKMSMIEQNHVSTVKVANMFDQDVLMRTFIMFSMLSLEY